MLLAHSAVESALVQSVEDVSKLIGVSLLKDRESVHQFLGGQLTIVVPVEEIEYSDVKTLN